MQKHSVQNVSGFFLYFKDLQSRMGVSYSTVMEDYLVLRIGP